MPSRVSVNVVRVGRVRVCVRMFAYYFRRPCVIWPLLLTTILGYVTILWWNESIAHVIYQKPRSSHEYDVTHGTSLPSRAGVIFGTDYERMSDWAVKDGRVDMEQVKQHLQKIMAETNTTSRFLELNLTSLCEEPEDVIPQCRKWLDPAVNVTARASVVLVMGDATAAAVMTAFLALVRHTPLAALEEVLLVGDRRSPVEVFDVLEAITDVLPLVRLFQLDKVKDDFKLKSFAAKFAHSEILVFLQSDVRVTPGWIHPLLAQLTLHPTSVVFPNLIGQEGDVHSAEGLRMRREIALDLSTDWGARSPKEMALLATFDFLPETVLPEYGMALTRTLFHQLHEFDEFPGALAFENMMTAFSLKVMQCAGGVVQAVCSNVARMPFPRRRATVQSIAKYRYLAVLAEIWFSNTMHRRAYRCLLPRQRNTSLTYHQRRMVAGMRKWMTWHRCKPLQTLVSKDRLELRLPESSATRAGRAYVQGKGPTELALDDDMRTLVFRPRPAYLTSLFSLTEERFIYNRKCVTMEDATHVVLRTCRQGDRRQRWVTNQHTLRPWTDSKLCLGRLRPRNDGATKSPRSSNSSSVNPTLSLPAKLFHCNDASADIMILFTLEFNRKCVK